MKGNGEEPDFSRHQDKSCSVIIEALQHATLESEIGEESCFFYRLRCAMEQVYSIESLRNMNTKDFQMIQLAVKNYLLSVHPDDHVDVHNVLRSIEAIESKVGNVGGTA